MFCKKFYGLKEAEKALRNIRICYRIRLILLSLFYYKDNRQYMIEHDKKIISFLKDIYKEKLI